MQWTNENILSQADHSIPLWKQQIDVASFPKMGNTFYQSFPIMQSSLGTTVNVLLLAFDENLDPAGHIIIPVTFPASPGALGPAAGSESPKGLQGNAVLRYDLPFIEIHTNENNPLSGIVKLKNLNLPSTVTLGRLDLETQSGWPEVHFGVTFASNKDYSYGIAIHQAVGLARLQGGYGYMELKGEYSMLEMHSDVWETDINNNHLQGHDIGNARLTEATGNSLTWEFTIFDSMKIDMNNLLYIGYNIYIHDGVQLQRTYAFINGNWEDMGDQIVDNYIINN